MLEIELNVPPIPLLDGRAAAVVADELQAATEYAVNLAVGTILPLTPIDRGMLRGGMQTEVFGERTEIMGRVFNPLEYALPVETGAQAHFPPPDALEGWGRRKLGQEGLGYVLARAISKRGTKGAFMLKRGLEACRGRIVQRFEEALQRLKDRLAG